MKPKEQKYVCDIISIVANAVATGTIPEAQDYMLEKFDDINCPIFQHAFSVLDMIQNKQQQSEDNSSLTFIHTELYYG